MKRLLFSLVLAFAVVSLQAQLLWKVSGNGLVKDSYILGTVHIVPAYVMDIIPGLNTALENCDVVVGETDIKDDNPDEPKWYTAPADSTLDKLFVPEDYGLIQDKLNRIAGKVLDFSKLNQCKPVKIYIEMMKMMIMHDYSDDDFFYFIDDGIMKRAMDMGRQTMGLEDEKFQTDLIVELIGNSPLDRQADMLMELLLNNEAIEVMRSDIFQAIGRYTIQRLDYYESDYDEDEKLVSARNRDWIPKLEALMPRQSCLVVVGIDHLLGEQGVLNLLLGRGYTLEPMK